MAAPARSAPRPDLDVITLDADYVRPDVLASRKGLPNSFLSSPPSRTRHAKKPAADEAAFDDLGVPGVITVQALIQGREMNLRCAELAEFDLYDLPEVRRPGARRRAKNLTGAFPIRSPRGPYSSVFESELESAHLWELTWQGVDELTTQPFRFVWRWPDGWVDHHVPDFIYRAGGRTVVVDVSARAKLRDDPSKRRLFDLTQMTCARVGWDYEVGTGRGLGPVRRANLGRILRARDVDVEPLGYTPRTVGGLVRGYGGGPSGWVLADAALWHRLYFIDMREPLEDTSRLVSSIPSPRSPWEVR